MLSHLTESLLRRRLAFLAPAAPPLACLQPDRRRELIGPPFDVWHAFICGCCPLPECTSARMQLHAGTPVGLAEGRGSPPHALMSSVAGLLLARDQLVVQGET